VETETPSCALRQPPYLTFPFGPISGIKVAVVIKAHAKSECWSRSCQLPYKMTVVELQAAVEGIYDFLYAVNSALARQELGMFENIALGNTFSGLLSEILVKNIAKHSKGVMRNRHVGGHPDLIPVGHPGGDDQLRCDQGVEVKTSRQGGGWQAHNAETGWLIVFRYELASGESSPTRFVQILAADLEAGDWSLAERKATSRRTRTCSINQRGVEKLRANPVYQEEEFVVGQRH
jgi:hypothetical protein